MKNKNDDEYKYLTVCMLIGLCFGTVSYTHLEKAADTTTAAGTATTAADTGAQTEAPKDLPVWPFMDKEITFYTRNSAGGSVTLSQQYLLDIVFEGGGTNLLVSDATSGGAVCVEKTYADVYKRQD